MRYEKGELYVWHRTDPIKLYDMQAVVDTPTIVIEADEEFETSKARQDQMLEEIRTFLAKL
jgi:hypothetical protein